MSEPYNDTTIKRLEDSNLAVEPSKIHTRIDSSLDEKASESMHSMLLNAEKDIDNLSYVPKTNTVSRRSLNISHVTRENASVQDTAKEFRIERLLRQMTEI